MEKIFLAIAACLVLAGCAHDGRLNRIPSFHFPPPGEVQIPDHTRKTLENGLTVILMEDRRLPLVNFQAAIGTGAAYDPADKAGLAEMTFEVMRTGGAGNMAGDKIDEFLEHTGAQLSTGVNRDIGWVSGLSDNRNFQPVFAVFSDMLQAPRFSEEKIELSRVRKRSEISRRNDNIGNIADREFRRLVYGKDSPYARITEYDTIERVSRGDMLEFHRKYFAPGNIIIGIWGDFETAAMLDFLEHKLGKWPASGAEKRIRPEAAFGKDSTIQLFVKEDATQSVIVMGHIGLQRDHPDYAATVVLSRILGAGWYSRFSRKLRQEKGLAYSVWASFIPEFKYPGMFIARAQTRAEKTAETLAYMQKELEAIQDGITEEELNVAREGILNSEVFWFDTTDKIMHRLIRYAYYDYPCDYPERLIRQVQNITADDILEAATKHLHHDNLAILVVGNPEKFTTPLPGNTKIIEVD